VSLKDLHFYPKQKLRFSIHQQIVRFIVFSKNIVLRFFVFVKKL